MKRKPEGEPAAAHAVSIALQRAETAEQLRAEFRRMAGNTTYWEALEAARAAPVAALLDEFALQDLVSLEVYMSQYKDVPRFQNDEHARKTWECIDSVRSATDSMRANRWLRQAMAYSKDFMLWDDSIKGEKFRGGKPKGAVEPLAKRIKEYLDRQPRASAEEVWDALRKRPPKGFEFWVRTARTEPYIRKPDGSEIGWRSFQNSVSRHRPKG